jgi:hypothetical protein
LTVVAGIPQPARATILSARTQLTTFFDVGSPLSMIVTNLDGTVGSEVAFVGSNSMIVITQRSKERTIYQVGPISVVDPPDFDGFTGSELLVTRLDGTLAVVNHRLRKLLIV